MRVVFLGTPAFAVPSLELLARHFDVVGVVTQPDRPAGRGQALQMPPVKAAAVQLGIPVLQPSTLRDPTEVDRLRALRPDVLVVVAYGEILRRVVREIAPLRCLNVHPSLLPRHRGAAPVVGAILEGDEVTGVTIMQLTRELDAGPILAQIQEPILPDDTTATLSERLARIGAKLLVDVLPRWAAGNITPTPQEDEAATCVRQLRRGDGRVDWTRSAVEIARRARAFDPWPGTFTTWNGRQIKLMSLVPLDRPAEGYLPGDVIPSSSVDGLILVAAGQAVVGIASLQMEGKRQQSAADFLRGQRHLIGARLGT